MRKKVLYDGMVFFSVLPRNHIESAFEILAEIRTICAGAKCCDFFNGDIIFYKEICIIIHPYIPDIFHRSKVHCFPEIVVEFSS